MVKGTWWCLVDLICRAPVLNLHVQPRSDETPETITNLKQTKSWGICSSPLRGDKINSIYWKRVWLERHDFMPVHANCIFTHKKEKYTQDGKTKQPNILVDDKLENIERWRIAGGIGVHFQANECSYTDLIDKLFRLASEHTRKH